MVDNETSERGVTSWSVSKHGQTDQAAPAAYPVDASFAALDSGTGRGYSHVGPILSFRLRTT
jgi:hypothetical protein